MIQKYRNESIVIASLIILTISIIYKYSVLHQLENQITATQKSIQEIEEAKRLKKLWYAKRVNSKLSKLKSTVPFNKIEKFKKRNKRVNIVLKKLESRELNRFMNELSKLPLRIARLKIVKISTNQYNMECLCKW